MKKIFLLCLLSIFMPAPGQETLLTPERWKCPLPAVFRNNLLRLPPQSLAVYQNSGNSREITLDVSLQVHSSKEVGQAKRYLSSGLRLIDGNRYWAFQLVQRPNQGGRYLELCLFQNQKWQYNIGRTREILRENVEGCWNFEQKLRLILKLTSTGIRGTLLDGSTTQTLAQIEYVFTDDTLLRSGTPALWNGGLPSDYSDFKLKEK